MVELLTGIKDPETKFNEMKRRILRKIMNIKKQIGMGGDESSNIKKQREEDFNYNNFNKFLKKLMEENPKVMEKIINMNKRGGGGGKHKRGGSWDSEYLYDDQFLIMLMVLFGIVMVMGVQLFGDDGGIVDDIEDNGGWGWFNLILIAILYSVAPTINEGGRKKRRTKKKKLRRKKKGTRRRRHR